ncbi:sugar ABC transporter substrate-binding protein [candidate division KSB3 bacterium]|uniref:Sugar ABC transporter substrate-binding protein n=1 Tax=candidate division KSB3 bacterium TaxID=2044937 RepID=A0A2G6KGB3_9BACT|nr:MAG: sugar ABC transporter substrate-binding protein [candidate division KSB3 bacterium]
MKICGLCFSLVIAAVLIVPEQTCAQKIVRLVTAEHEPYIGENLPNKGYVYEVVAEAFQRAGYEVEIAFYPVARATYLVEKGWRDGFVPVYYDRALEGKFLFSDPFPGGTLGLLKRKDIPVKYLDPRDQTQALRRLKNYTFGVVRGSVNTPEFDNAVFLKKDFATSDMQNLLKLSKGRIDLAVIDKYTAADIMVNKLPHMIGAFEFMSPPLALKPFYIAFSKHTDHSRQLANDFNQGLLEVIRDKTVEHILYKHGLLQTQEPLPGKTKIRIGTVESPYMILMKQLSREFERQHPDIELAWSVLDENILRLRLMSDLAISDGRFDIMMIGSYETPIWAKRGWLLPFDNLSEDYAPQDIADPVREGLSYDGRLYALPFYAESSMTFYRKDLFEKAGLTMPRTPSWDNIREFAEKIHDPANDIYGICLRGEGGWGANMAFFNTLVNTFGGQWFDEQWNTTIDTPEWRNALNFYSELLTDYGPPDAASKDYNELLRLFSDGQCGIWVDATVFAGTLFNPRMSKVAKQVGFAAAPVAVTPKGSHWLWVWALAIPKSSNFPAEARQFITWATSKAYIELVARHEGWVAVPSGTRKSTYRNKNYLSVAPFASFVFQAIQSADPTDSTLHPSPYNGIQYVSIPEFPAIGAQVGQKIAEVLTGKVSVNQALKELQRSVSEQMRASGYTQ